MLRARLVAAVTIDIGIAGLGLVGCASASAPSWMPSWMTIKPPPPPTEALQFESEPAGADVHAADGQTCRTPCTLTLPVTSQSVNFAMNGYVPQTLPVEVRQGSDPPDLQPNPVLASLQAVPKPVVKPKPKKPKVAAKTAARPVSSEQPSIAAPEPASAPAQDQDNVFPPPPQLAAPSPFPPPPQTR